MPKKGRNSSTKPKLPVYSKDTLSENIKKITDSWQQLDEMAKLRQYIKNKLPGKT